MLPIAPTESELRRSSTKSGYVLTENAVCGKKPAFPLAFVLSFKTTLLSHQSVPSAGYRSSFAALALPRIFSITLICSQATTRQEWEGLSHVGSCVGKRTTTPQFE